MFDHHYKAGDVITHEATPKLIGSPVNSVNFGLVDWCNLIKLRRCEETKEFEVAGGIWAQGLPFAISPSSGPRKLVIGPHAEPVFHDNPTHW